MYQIYWNVGIKVSFVCYCAWACLLCTVRKGFAIFPSTAGMSQHFFLQRVCFHFISLRGDLYVDFKLIKHLKKSKTVYCHSATGDPVHYHYGISILNFFLTKLKIRMKIFAKWNWVFHLAAALHFWTVQCANSANIRGEKNVGLKTRFGIHKKFILIPNLMKNLQKPFRKMLRITEAFSYFT
jgi:hypothetical protein